MCPRGLAEYAAIAPEGNTECCLPLSRESLTRQASFDARPEIGTERIDPVDHRTDLQRLR
jgi:hypothetical protein